jgi:ribosomal protein S18 acetylase RimI-like enzyme
VALTEALAIAGTESNWDGLLVTRRSTPGGDAFAVEGVVWVQILPGRSAVLWGPPRDDAAQESLLLAAAAYLDAQQISIGQQVVGESDGYSAPLLARCGFPKFAELSYLFAGATGRGATTAARQPEVFTLPSGGRLEFVPGAGDEPQRLGAVLNRTYIDSQDCPALEGVRSMEHVLEGYRSQGAYSPQNWYFVQLNGVDVGALLLAEHATVKNCEVVYMGVAPEVRRRGLGATIMRFALGAAAQMGAERLVLAVDAQNEPAMATYRNAGFIEWDRRIVYARLRGPS